MSRQIAPLGKSFVSFCSAVLFSLSAWAILRTVFAIVACLCFFVHRFPKQYGRSSHRNDTKSGIGVYEVDKIDQKRTIASRSLDESKEKGRSNGGPWPDRIQKYSVRMLCMQSYLERVLLYASVMYFPVPLHLPAI